MSETNGNNENVPHLLVPFSNEFVENVIKNNLKTSATFRQFRYERIAEHAGDTSKILRLTIQWSSLDDENLPETVILKIPTPEKLKPSENSDDNKESMKIREMFSSVSASLVEKVCDVSTVKL